MTVFILTNYNSTLEQDLERIYILRDLKYQPYVMVYNKEQTRTTDTIRQLQRWVNNPYIFNSCKTFEEYYPYYLKKMKGMKANDNIRN